MNTLNPWVVLAIAIVLEVCGTLCLKMSNGMTRLLPVLGVAVFYVSTFVLMAISMKTLEVGTAYAVWAGLGTALITVAGIVMFGESFAWTKILGTALIVAGVVFLHASSSPH
jgi:multidrug transporter EmrE-like cation transporter